MLAFSVTQFALVPFQNAQTKKYELTQKDPCTHDLNSILRYKNHYLGNNSNTIHLFYQLPLAEAGMRFQIFSENLSLKVEYPYSASIRGERTVNQSLIYNSVAAFALISNLQKITFRFTDKAVTITRTDVEKIYRDPSALLQKDIWKTKVQNLLQNKAFVTRCQKIMFQTKQ